MKWLNQALVGGGPNVEQKNLAVTDYQCLRRFIKQVNIASFISKLARFIHVACIKESFQALDNV